MRTKLWPSHPLRWVALASGLALVVSLVLISRAFAETLIGSITFVRDSNIWVRSPGGTFSQRTSSGSALWPTQSPVDGRIAYVFTPKNGQTDLWVMNANGSTQRLTNDPYIERSPEWSPDGRKIVFCSQQNGPFLLYAIDSNVSLTTAPLPLVQIQGMHIEPTWSPDGNWIAFARPAPGGSHRAIWVIPAVGGQETQIFNHLSDSVSDLAWSPDGAQIAFMADGDIWTVDVTHDSGGFHAIAEHRLTNTTRAGERWPTWESNGLLSRIAFATDRDRSNTGEIYVMGREGEVDGPAAVNLTNSLRTDDAYPAWSR